MDPNTQTMLSMLFTFIPSPYGTYAADLVGIAGVLSMLASIIAAKVQPPSAVSATWLQTAYRIVTWPALNLGWARSAVVPGMHPDVQQAAIAVAQVVAKMPALAPMPVMAGVVPAVPASAT